MADVNIRAVISADDRASGTIKGFSTTAVAAGTAIGNAFYNVASRAMQSFSDDIGDAIRRVDTLSNAGRTFENMGFKIQDSKSAMDALNKSILGLPTPLDTAVQGVTLLASATNDVGKSQKVFSALNDAILGFGGTADMAQNAVVQLSQDLAGGVIHAQTWNSLLNSGLGPALAAMARQMGITTSALRDGLSTGSISVENFTDTLIKLDTEGGGGMKSLHQIAKDSTNGIQTSFTNAKTSIVRSMADIVQGIGQANIAAAVKAVGDGISGIISSIGALIKAFESAPLLFFAVTGALLGLATAMIVSAIPAIIATTVAFGAMAIAVVAATWPFLVVGAIAASAAYLIISNWSTLANFFTKTLPSLFNSAMTGIGNFFTGIENWASKTVKNITDSFTALPGKIVSSLGNITNSIASDVKSAFHNIHIPGFASGVQNFSGGLAVVGERGPELVNLPGGSSVIPNSKIGQVSSNQTVNITVQAGAFMGNPSDARKYAQLIADALKHVAGSKNMSAAEYLS